MKHKYRGVPYRYEPAAVTFGGEPIAVTFNRHVGEEKYRGAPAKYAIFTADIPYPEFELNYRGFTRHIGQAKGFVSSDQGSDTVLETTDSENPATVKPVSIDERLRQLMMAHHRQIRKREQAMLVRLDARTGLSVEDATHFRNHIQGYIPYDEWMNYDRSHAAMS